MTTVVTEVTFFSHVLFFSIFIIIIMINNYCLLILIKLLRGGNPNISCHIINIILKTRSVRIILWRESLSDEVHLASIYFYYFFILFFYYYLLLFVALSLLRWEIIRRNHTIGEYSGGYFNLPQLKQGCKNSPFLTNAYYVVCNFPPWFLQCSSLPDEFLSFIVSMMPRKLGLKL